MHVGTSSNASHRMHGLEGQDNTKQHKCNGRCPTGGLTSLFLFSRNLLVARKKSRRRRPTRGNSHLDSSLLRRRTDRNDAQRGGGNSSHERGSDNTQNKVAECGGGNSSHEQGSDTRINRCCLADLRVPSDRKTVGSTNNKKVLPYPSAGIGAWDGSRQLSKCWL